MIHTISYNIIDGLDRLDISYNRCYVLYTCFGVSILFFFSFFSIVKIIIESLVLFGIRRTPEE